MTSSSKTAVKSLSKLEKLFKFVKKITEIFDSLLILIRLLSLCFNLIGCQKLKSKQSRKQFYEKFDFLKPNLSRKTFWSILLFYFLERETLLNFPNSFISIFTRIISAHHSGPKMLKSKQRGAGPKFIYHVKGGYIVISKNKIFFKSVEGKFWQLSEKIWAGFPRALPPGISIRKWERKFWKKTPFLLN